MTKPISKYLNVIVAALLLVAMGLLAYTHYKLSKTEKMLVEIEYMDSVNNYNKLYYEESISELKKKNRQLYDSLESSRKLVTYLIQFTANHSYDTGIVTVKPKPSTNVEKEDTTTPTTTPTLEAPKTYVYVNEPNDTMSYTLKINAFDEPNWYSIAFRTSSKYTIVNKAYADGMNHITIGDDSGNSEITDVTVFKKKESNQFFKKFSVGPTVALGYDPVNNKLSPVIGVGLTYNLFGK